MLIYILLQSDVPHTYASISCDMGKISQLRKQLKGIKCSLDVKCMLGCINLKLFSLAYSFIIKKFGFFSSKVSLQFCNVTLIVC